MNQTYTALIQQREDWWIGWVEEIPGVNCQERTREELLDTLQITLIEALEFNRQQAISVAESGYQEVPIQI
jgi:predicted RNase H-like HicB family nuclease